MEADRERFNTIKDPKVCGYCGKREYLSDERSCCYPMAVKGRKE